ncbi:MAG: trigger factor [Lachnospiraceae bacterium]|jgi:trigger factor|nr:trigger factor [Lachnospiraceae bacterium]MCI9283124.1 trigger factor [Lachnospiraceae bacterium]
MRKLIKPFLCGMMVMVLVTGCSKKQGVEETTVAESQEETSEGALAGEEQTTAVDLGEVTSLGEYKGLEITRMSTEVSEEELDVRIQSILDANPEYVTITDRAAKNGDIVDIDYVGMKDGVAFEGGTAQGYKLELGSHSFIDGFEEGLIGVKTGDERSLNLTFPEQYHSEELAGQAVVFDVTVNGIEEKKEAVLDNNFVQRMSDFSTVDEFKADTMADMQAEKEQQADQQLENDVFQAAVENCEFDLNQTAVDNQYNNQLSYYNSMVSMYGMELADYVSMFGMTEEQFQEDLLKSAEISIKQQLLVKAIAEKEGFQIEEADREIVAEQYGMDVKTLQDTYGEEAVDTTAMMYKVVNFLKDNADVK